MQLICSNTTTFSVVVRTHMWPARWAGRKAGEWQPKGADVADVVFPSFPGSITGHISTFTLLALHVAIECIGSFHEICDCTWFLIYLCYAYSRIALSLRTAGRDRLLDGESMPADLAQQPQNPQPIMCRFAGTFNFPKSLAAVHPTFGQESWPLFHNGRHPQL